MTRRATVALSLLLLGAGFAMAQEVAPAPQQQPPAIDPKACGPADRLQPGSPNPSAPSATTGENLSDKLARTDGVICPPNVDPDIRAPTPNPGASPMPVIPPPGSPGGDPSVRPK